MEKKIKKVIDRWVPYQWPWTDPWGNNMPILEAIKSRKFTLIYLSIIWGIVAILGFASTRPENCDKTWQLTYYCEQSIWMIKFVTEPLAFVKSWFTAGFFHNGLDHILFVTIIGMIMPVQTFEVNYGWKPTALIFMGAYIFTGLYSGIFFNVGLLYWPDSEFIQIGFERSWIGGSVGFYALIGALSYVSKFKWVLPAFVGLFELMNLTVLDIHVHITFIHVHCVIFGFFSSWWLTKKGFLKSHH